MWSMAGMTVARFGVEREKYKVACLRTYAINNQKRALRHAETTFFAPEEHFEAARQ